MIRPISFFFACVLLASCAKNPLPVEPQAAPPANQTVEVQNSGISVIISKRPKNLILIIPDGFGPSSLTAAREFKGLPLALDGITHGNVQTRSTDSPVTDSAAGATAYATGHRTYNGAISVDPEKRPLATLLEAASARGMKTGLVVTSKVTHATPACFASHVPQRYMEEEIALQILDHNVDVIFGGGIEFFQPSSSGGARKDDRDLLSEARSSGVSVVLDRDDMMASNESPILGLFSRDHMAFEIDRETTKQPSLEEMSLKAIGLLKGSEEGFFLMIEASRIDHAGHDNDIAAHIGDILAYDEMLSSVLRFADIDRETLLVSVADHETGGLSVGRKVGTSSTKNWLPDELRNVTASLDFMEAEASRTNNPDSVWAAETGFEFTAEERARLEEAKSSEVYGAASNTVGAIIAERSLTGWTTDGHTGVDVTLGAFGVGSSRFKGSIKNHDVGRFLAKAMDFDLDTLTEELREK